MGDGAMNILFVTQDDPFYVKIFFKEFLGKYPDLSEIKGAVIGSTLGKKSLPQLVKQMLEFYGPMGFLVMGTKYVLKKVSGDSLKRLFESRGIPCQERNDVNSPSFIEEWRKKEIDVIISVASSAIFKQALLEMPRWGCLNIHHAKLPKYRGMLPNFWQMFNDEKFAGITVHRMNPKIDDGEIVAQRELEILPGEPLESLIKRSKKAGAGLMLEVIETIRAGKVSYLKNDSSVSSYYTFPGAADVKEFKRRGKRIL
jgi:methionyl-tRNA formyltransferase